MSRLIIPRRVFLTLAGAGAGAAALAACTPPVSAPSGTDSGSGSATPTSAEVDNINPDMRQTSIGQVPEQYKGRTAVMFWAPWTGGVLDAVTALVDEFNESQTDIYVAIESQVDYPDLVKGLKAALQAKAVPDLVGFAEMQWIEFFFSGALAKLDVHFDDSWNSEIFPEMWANEGKAHGETYAVPFGRSTPMFYYNKTVFQDLGLPVDTQYTWSQLREFGPEIASVQVAGQPMKTFAYPGILNSWCSRAWLSAFDGVWSDGLTAMPDEDAVRELMTFAQDWVHTDGTAYLSEAGSTDLTTGIVASSHGSSAGLRGVTDAADFEVGAAFMPGEINQPPQVPTGGSVLAMLRSESQERQDATAEFLKFLGTPEASAKLHIATGYIPLVKGATEVPEVVELHASDPNWAVTVDQVQNAKTSDTFGWFTSSLLAMNAAWTSLLGDNEDVDTVIETLRGEIEDTLESNRDQLEAYGV